MNKEEIKEYLKRVGELELKLTGEDKDTLQWLIYGYNECARLLNQLETNRVEAIEYIKNNTKYFDSEYVSIYGELCDIAGAGDTRTHCVIGDEQLLEILERIDENVSS